MGAMVRFGQSCPFSADGAAVDNGTPQSLSSTSHTGPDVDKPYSIYTAREKWFIVAVSAFAAIFRFVFLPQYGCTWRPLNRLGVVVR